MADEDEKPSKRSVSTKALANAVRVATDRKHKLREAEAKATRLEQENAELAKRPTAEKVEQENKELKDRLRTNAHRQAFDAAARDAGVHPSALEDAFDSAVKSGSYKVEGDAANPELVKTAIGSVKEAKPFLFAPATEGDTGAGNANPALAKKPIESKGNPVPTPVAGQIKRSDLRDPRKALTLDRKAVSEAIKAGTIIDD